MNNETLTRIEGSPCYPFLAGTLQSALRGLVHGNIPGIKVTDFDAFNAYLENKIVECHNSSVKYERGESVF